MLCLAICSRAANRSTASWYELVAGCAGVWQPSRHHGEAGLTQGKRLGQRRDILRPHSAAAAEHCRASHVPRCPCTRELCYSCAYRDRLHLQLCMLALALPDAGYCLPVADDRRLSTGAVEQHAAASVVWIREWSVHAARDQPIRSHFIL
jgi:hypothetical protein